MTKGELQRRKRAEQEQRLHRKKEEAWEVFQRQPTLQRKTREEFETKFREKVLGGLHSNSKDEQEKDLQSWVNELEKSGPGTGMEARGARKEKDGAEKTLSLVAAKPGTRASSQSQTSSPSCWSQNEREIVASLVEKRGPGGFGPPASRADHLSLTISLRSTEWRTWTS